MCDAPEVIGHLAPFLLLAVVVIVTPGQDTALTIRNALRGGRSAGIATAVGVSSGQLAWTVAASAGIAALLVASEPAFLALRIVGAAYLVWLGGVALLAAWRGHGPGRETRVARRPPTLLGAWRQGLLSNISNPKMAVFFTSLLPQFAPSSGPAFLVMLGLGVLFCLMTAGWLAAYAVAVSRAGHILRRPRVRRALDALTGIVLVALGLRLATERR